MKSARTSVGSTATPSGPSEHSSEPRGLAGSRLVTRTVRLADELGNTFRMIGVGGGVRYTRGLLRAIPEVVRTGNLQAADSAMPPDVIACHFDGRVMQLPGKYYGLAREIVGRGVYEYGGFRVQPGDRVLDLGANVGVFAIKAALEGAVVYAVEAQQGFMSELAELARLNHCEHRVHPVWALVGEGTGVFSDPRQRQIASHWRGDPETPSLDWLLDCIEGGQAELLKVDIEGSEFDMFRRSKQALHRVRRIAMEVHAASGPPEVLVAILRDAGFVVRLFTPSGREISASTGDCYAFAHR